MSAFVIFFDRSVGMSVGRLVGMSVCKPSVVRSISFDPYIWSIPNLVHWLHPISRWSLLIFRSHVQRSRSNHSSQPSVFCTKGSIYVSESFLVSISIYFISSTQLSTNIGWKDTKFIQKNWITLKLLLLVKIIVGLMKLFCIAWNCFCGEECYLFDFFFSNRYKWILKKIMKFTITWCYNVTNIFEMQK